MKSLASRADELLGRAVAAGEVPGVVAMAVQGEEVIYEGAFGRRALGRDEPMQADSVFWLASMTKPLTTAVALQLVERGRLSLDEPVERRMPEIRRIEVLDGFDAAGQPRLRPPRSPVTLRQLLNHTSGFGYEFWNGAIQRYRKERRLPSVGSSRRAGLDTPLVFDPGTRWQYGIGIDWTGLLIEAVTGQRLGAVLREELLGPLGMDDTAFRLGPSMRARLAKVHQRGSDGTLVATDVAVPAEPEVEMGGSGLYGTAGEYLRFLRLILQAGRWQGTGILRRESVDAMASPQIGAHRLEALQTVMPGLARSLDLYPGLDKTFGFGFQINRERASTGASAGCLLWSGLANTHFWIDPSRRLAGVFLTQVLPFADPATIGRYLQFQQAVYESL